MSDSLAAPKTAACQAPLCMGFPSKNTGVGCHFLFQGIFLTQGLNLRFLHWWVDSLPLSHQGGPLSKDLSPKDLSPLPAPSQSLMFRSSNKVQASPLGPLNL